MTTKNDKVDLGKVAQAAFEGVKKVFPDAVLSEEQDRYGIQLSGNAHKITVEYPLSPNGHVNINGLHELLVPVQVRTWVIVDVLNAGNYIEYDKVTWTLRVYQRDTKFLTR